MTEKFSESQKLSMNASLILISVVIFYSSLQADITGKYWKHIEIFCQN